VLYELGETLVGQLLHLGDQVHFHVDGYLVARFAVVFTVDAVSKSSRLALFVGRASSPVA